METNNTIDPIEISIILRQGGESFGRSFQVHNLFKTEHVKDFLDFNIKEICRLKEEFGRWPTREEWEANIIRHS